MQIWLDSTAGTPKMHADWYLGILVLIMAYMYTDKSSYIGCMQARDA